MTSQVVVFWNLTFQDPHDPVIIAFPECCEISVEIWMREGNR